MVNKKECCICGNTDEKEIEEITLFSDEDGNDGKFKKWLCEEGKGCY